MSWVFNIKYILGISLVSALGTGFAAGFTSFMISRILGGIGIGIASCISPIYIAEVSPRKMSGKFVSLNQLIIVIGILVAQNGPLFARFLKILPVFIMVFPAFWPTLYFPIQ
jgi:MFS family permease